MDTKNITKISQRKNCNRCKAYCEGTHDCFLNYGVQTDIEPCVTAYSGFAHVNPRPTEPCPKPMTRKQMSHAYVNHRKWKTYTLDTPEKGE